MSREVDSHHDQVLTTLTLLHLRTQLLHRQLARHQSLSAADRLWLETSLAEITRIVRSLTPLVTANSELPGSNACR